MISSEQSFQKAIEGLYDHPLSQEEKNEAVANLTGFFDVLIEIDQSLNQNK
ncbi:hypothetical protein GW756_05745 [bacterium]|nr:hypothetical protein [bacterium]NCQ55923.1 hypothetical protein [Candidatus Parcubacteria bacterium]NCS67948.1 hypothetical protein [Candidatus Peregrinibacteria bacterium]NCS96842.1 hypothetical protein [bacterium]